MVNSQLKPSVESFLSIAGINMEGVKLSQMDDGGNNQVFAVDNGRQKYLAKAYFSNPEDSRDRLGAEYSFLSYAVETGLKCVPKPVYKCREKNMGLYEFVEGRKLVSSELGRQHVMEAARFIRELNSAPNRGQTLPTASEGCFSVEEHFEIVDLRIRKLKGIPVKSDLDCQALSFVGELEAAWEGIKRRITADNDSPSVPLKSADRCISPSDFGFHNALLRESGDICFIDFEYAGWDDPAKMVGDFFLQPEVPVPVEYFDQFAEEALAYSFNKVELKARARLLFPIFQIKWCCIMLNEFLPDAAKRRRFARPTKEPEIRKQKQLAKTQIFLAKGGLV